MKNPTIKLVASDLDGTLLNSNKEITPATFSAIKKLQEHGIIFVPITGRVLSAVPKSVLTLPGVEYIVTSNGAATNYMPNKSEILSYHLSPSTVNTLMEIVRGKPIVVEVFTQGLAYCEKNTLDNLSSYGIQGQHAFYMTSTRTPIEDTFAFLKENSNSIENINLIFNDMTLRQSLYKELKEKDFASITTSSPVNIEITHKNATKATALLNLCSLLGIENHEVMCFGDSENDMDMLETFEFSFAMEDANPLVKSASNFQSESCDKNGVATSLEKFLFDS